MLAPQYLHRSTLWFTIHLLNLLRSSCNALHPGNQRFGDWKQNAAVPGWGWTKMLNLLKIKTLSLWLHCVMKADGIYNNKHKVPDSNWQCSIDRSSNQQGNKQTQKSGHLISKKWGSTHSHPGSLDSEMIHTEIGGRYAEQSGLAWHYHVKMDQIGQFSFVYLVYLRTFS